jgi:hypothetical protein
MAHFSDLVSLMQGVVSYAHVQEDGKAACNTKSSIWVR